MNGAKREEDYQLAAEYVLGLLSESERDEFERRLQLEPRLREEYQYWSEHFASMADSLEQVAPSPSVKSELEGKLAKETTALWWQKWRSSPVVGWGMAAALLIGLSVWLLTPQSFTPDYMATLHSVENRLEVAAFYDQDSALLQLEPRQGRALPGRDLELWIIVAEQSPVSLGVLSMDKTQKIAVPDSFVKQIVGASLAISDEPEGGSPTGLPTGAVLVVAEVHAI